MYFLYSVVLCAYLLALFPVVAYQWLRHGKSVGRIQDRIGNLRPNLNPHHTRSIWIHAVSVGEVLAARSLLHSLRRIYPTHRLLLSTVTASGQQVASGLGDSIDGRFYAPFDFSPCVSSALDRVAPDLLILIDTEIWPTLLHVCQRRGVKTVIVNGRMSKQSYCGYRCVRWFMRRVLNNLDRVCAQTKLWGTRFVDLGLPLDRLTVTGSLKFDSVDILPTSTKLYAGDSLLRCFQFVTDRPVLIAASTLRGEEEPVLRAFAKIRSRYPDAVLILAPRHPERFEEAYRIATGHGFKVIRRTELSLSDQCSAEVVVLDTLGELVRLFQVATLVFVGGSLVAAGGHNLLEPAAFGKAIVVGPHMDNFAEITDLFLKHDALRQVDSPSGLETALIELMVDREQCISLGTAARALVDTNKGPGSRCIEIISELIPPESEGYYSDAQTFRALS